MPEILGNDPVWVYQTTVKDLVSGAQRFISFQPSDILYIEQVWGEHDTSLDSVEKREICCIVLKDRGQNTPCIHIDKPFQEIMLRWVNFIESRVNA